jgi:hypothetical protein
LLIGGDSSTLNGVDDAVHYGIVSPQDTKACYEGSGTTQEGESHPSYNGDILDRN